MKFIFLGIIQGLTEFLPVSSSGHLYIFKKYLNLTQDLLPFFVFLHLATFLAIFVFLRKEIFLLLLQRKIAINILIISIITAGFGLLIDYFFQSFFENKYLVPFFLLINGGILLSVKNTSQKREAADIGFKDSLILGVSQGLAVFPGISRSGITIVALLKRGFKSKEAFSLSFLMAMPVILGVFLLKLKGILNSNIPATNMFLGFCAAFVFGLLALSLIKRALISEKFSKFGYYCILVSFLSLFFCR